MLNFKTRRDAERLPPGPTPQKGQTETDGPTSPIATRKKQATRSASTLVQHKLVSQPKPPATATATATALKATHARHWTICLRIADQLTKANSLCAAERFGELEVTRQQAIGHLNKLAGTPLPPEVLEVVNQVRTTAVPADLPSSADATARAVATLVRLLLRTSILAEEQALGSCPSLDRSEAVDRVALQVRAFSHAARASVTLRIRMEAGYRALEPAKEGTRDQTRKLLRRMADSLISDSLTS
jgi:hypothetical protein